MGCQSQIGVYGSQDANYLKALEAERIGLSGTTVEYYSLNRGTNVDAVYGEPTNDPVYGGSSAVGTPQRHSESWNFCPGAGDGTLTMPCSFEYTEAENRNPMVRPEGKIVEYDAVLMIADLHWECYTDELGETVVCIVGRDPKEGDVCYGMNEWWDVVKAGRSGNVLGTPVTVGWRLELKKRTQFVPERKLST